MYVSVIICTRNRAASLDRTLTSLAAMAVPAGLDWELLVVDNGSTDNTSAIIASFAKSLPIRRVEQPIAGLSNARNAGVGEALGDFILWTDDDVIVHENWLASWFRAFRERPDAAVFGGRTEPIFEEPQTPWFVANRQHLQSLLAVRDADWTEVTADQMPWGLNFAVRRVEQRTNLYDPQLGVAPGRRLGGEEVDVIMRILDAGGTGHWVWDATVYHLISAQRQTAAYIDEFYTASGMQFPIGGIRYGVVPRLNGLVIAIWILVRSWACVQFSRLKGKWDVANMVQRAVALGSCLRFMRRKTVN